MNVNIPRHVESYHFLAKVGGGFHNLPRDHSVLENPSTMIDVVEKKVQGNHTLTKSLLNNLPFAKGNNPRNKIEREDPLGSLIVSIDGKSNAMLLKGGSRLPLLGLDFQ